MYGMYKYQKTGIISPQQQIIPIKMHQKIISPNNYKMQITKADPNPCPQTQSQTGEFILPHSQLQNQHPISNPP